MITRKANELAFTARFSNDSQAHRDAWNELFENCSPTEAEFTEFAHGLVMFSDVIYRLVVEIPKWNQLGGKND